MGYAGGTSPGPTYANIGDHIESLEVHFDPEVVNYTDLLEVFAGAHDTTARAFSRQYISALFPVDGKQEAEARAFLEALAEELGGTPVTEVSVGVRFYPAEDYHQKFYLQAESALWAELRERFGSFDEAVLSNEAARINGYLGGFGTYRDLSGEIGEFGLSDAGADLLLDIVRLRDRDGGL